jgi:hypothetical protein
MSLIWRANAKEAVATVAEQGIGEIHTLVSSRVRSLLSMPPRVCRLNAQLINDGVLKPDELGTWYPTLKHQFDQFDMISTIGWGATDGQAAWISRYGDGHMYWALKDDPSSPTMREWRLDENEQIPPEPTAVFDYDLNTRPWYTTPLETDTAAWTAPYLWVGGNDNTIGISYGIPVRDDSGHVLGIIDADYSLTDLSKFLSSIELGPGGFLALIDTDGYLVAGSTLIDVLDDQNQRRHISDSAHPVLATARDALIGDGAQRGQLDPV